MAKILKVKLIYVISIVLAILCNNESIRSQGSSLVEVLPVHTHILALTFEEGMINYHKQGERADKDEVLVYRLNISKATQTTHYRLISNEDSDFAEGMNPVRVNRKSKANAFSGKWPNYPAIGEHKIYLEWETPLKDGKKYTLQIENDKLEVLQSEFHFTFNSLRSRSESIHVNQIGYLDEEGLPKYGYLYYWAGDKGEIDFADYENASFHIVDEMDNSVKFTGLVQYRGSGQRLENGRDNEARNYTRTGVWECDFSKFSQSGRYRLCIEGVGCSYPFSIGPDIYNEVFYHTARTLYHQRAGIAKDNGSTLWAFPRDHHPEDGFKVFLTDIRDLGSGIETNEWADRSTGSYIKSWGWYHDAGDWDPYPRHVRVANHLLAAYELFPDRFSDGQLDIPESSNGIPDILDEAAWVIYFLKRSIDLSPTGGVLARHNYSPPAPRGYPSWKDPQNWYSAAEDPSSTYFYAGGAAQLAVHLQALDHEAAQDSAITLKTSAIQAYEWAMQNTLESDEHEFHFKMTRLLASIWLFRLTGEKHYMEKIESYNTFDEVDSWDYRWMEVIFGLATCPDMTNLNTGLRELFRDMVIDHADRWIVETAENRNLRMGWDYNAPSFTGLQTTPQTMAALVAFYLVGDEKYKHVILTSADFNLGTNPLNMCWVTGLGHKRPDAGILHLDSWYYEFEGKSPGECIPGIIPYAHHVPGRDFTGQPNGPHNNDFALQQLYPQVSQWPVHETWQYNRQSPRTGEFTINQNQSPSIALYGFLSSPNHIYTPRIRPHLNFKFLEQETYFAPGDSLRLDVTFQNLSSAAELNFTINGLSIHNVTVDPNDPFSYPFTWEAFDPVYDYVWVMATLKDIYGNGSTAKVKLQRKAKATSISDNLSEKQSIKIFPNPVVNDTLHIDLPMQDHVVMIRIFAMDGNVIFEKRMENIRNTITLYTSSVPEGLHIIEVESLTFKDSAKIIIQR